MENLAVQKYVLPLVKKNLFTNEEDAIKELVYHFISQKIANLSSDIIVFENKYKMNYYQFKQLVKEESNTLRQAAINNKQLLSQLFMEHEDDLQDWKAKIELLDSWMNLEKGIS